MSLGAVSVGVNMFLRDNFSGPAARVGAAQKRLQGQMTAMQEQSLRSSRNMAAGMALGGAFAIKGIAKATRAYADYAYEMNYIGQITKATAKEEKNLSNRAMQLGQDTIYTTKQVADGMRWLAQSGMKYGEVMGNVQAATNLAAAAHLDIAGRGGAADILTNIMHAFKIGVEDSAYVTDVLAEAATNANTTVFELGEALKYSASTAMDLNMGLEESTAMVMTLANAGMQASMAGVAMENSMRYLAKSISKYASGTQKKALAGLGLSPDDFMNAEGDMNSMVQNITVLKKALTGVGNVASQSALQVLFGVRGKRAGSLLMRNYEEFIQNLKTLEKSQGRAGEIADDMMDTLKGGLMRLSVTWKNVGHLFVQGFAPVVKVMLKMLESLGKFIQFILKIPVIGKLLAGGIAGFILIKTVSLAYKAVLKTILLYQTMAANSAVVMAAKTTASYTTMTASAMRYKAMARMGLIPGIGYSQSIRKATVAKTGMVASAALLKKSAARPLMGIAAGGAIGKLGALLGGPWGIALAFGIPMAITGLSMILKKNKSATEDNTSALMTASEKEAIVTSQYSAMSHVIDILDQLVPGMGIPGMGGIGSNIPYNIRRPRTIENMGAAILTKDAQGNDVVVNISLDGEEIFSERMNNILNRNNKDTLRKIGL